MKTFNRESPLIKRRIKLEMSLTLISIRRYPL